MICPPEHDLHRLYDGELAPEKAADVRSHAANCAGCGAALAAWAAVSDAVRSAALPEPSAAAMRRWAAGRRADDTLRGLAGWMTAAAAAALAMAVVTGRTPVGGAAPTIPVSWETPMFAAGDADGGSDRLVAANWMVADLSAGQGGATWR